MPDGAEHEPDLDRSSPLGRPELSGRTRELCEALIERDPALGRMYLGARQAMEDHANPDRLPLAAHGFRELIEKLPRFLDLPIAKERRFRLGTEARNLAQLWDKLRETTFNDGRLTTNGEKLWATIERFCDGVASDPTRQKITQASLEQLDPSGVPLPEHLLSQQAKALTGIEGFFIGVSHHTKQTDEKEFTEYVGRLEGFLLDRLRPRTFDEFTAIDELLARSSTSTPSESDLDEALELLRRAANYHYFFEHLDSPEWIGPLADRGFFKDPPGLIDDGQTMRVPFWAESRFLSRMAARAPDVIAELIRDLPTTDNQRVHADIVDAVQAMPAPTAASLVKRIRRCLDGAYLDLLAGHIIALVERLARDGETTCAVELARGLLGTQGCAASQDAWRGHARPRFSYPSYESAVDRAVGAVREVDSHLAYQLAANTLGDILTAVGLDHDTGYDTTFVYRPTIDAPSALSHDDVVDVLISTVRDRAMDDAIDLHRVVADLDKRGQPVFRRIALYVLSERATAVDDVLLGRARQAQLLYDPALGFEFTRLLRRTCELADRHVVEELIDLLLSTTDPAMDADDERTRLKLAESLAVLDPLLPPRGQQALEQLSAEMGLTPEELVDRHQPGISFGTYVGPTSPTTTAELVEMTDDDLMRFLTSWVPPQGWHEPSPEGLGRELRDAVKEDPERFARLAGRFIGLQPTYVRSLLDGLQDAVANGGTFDWHAVLGLTTWVLRQRDEPAAVAEYNYDRDPDWSWSRRRIASLIKTGCNNEQVPIPFELRKQVWAQLAQLLEDLDPTPDHETTFGGSNMDPVTLSVNTVRGSAMHALVAYACWVRENLSDAEDFRAMPEVRAALEGHLDPTHDPSLAIRSAYGLFFPTLYALDAQWTSDHARSIFPTSNDEGAWFRAAWDAFILFSRPSDRLPESLAFAFTHAMRNPTATEAPTTRFTEPDRRLAEHLGVYVLRGILAPGSHVLVEFFRHAVVPVRGHLHWFIGNTVERERVPPDVLARGMAIWDDRRRAVQELPGDEHQELETFGAWFDAENVDPQWRVTELLAALRLTGGAIDDRFQVFQTLADLASQFPFESLNALDLMVRRSTDSWEIGAAEEHIMRTLRAGLGSVVHDRAVALVHHLGARGYHAFRTLLDNG